MAKQKVYLSKSNASDPDELMLVRKHLAKYDVEVVEFRGGNYSHSLMLDCDILLVLPPKDAWTPHGDFTVGRGQYEQLSAWNNFKEDHFILVISGLNDTSMLVYDVLGWEQNDAKDQNWQDYWATVNTYDILESIDNYLDIESELTSTDSKMTYYDFETSAYPQFIRCEDSVVPMLACITLIK